MIVTIGLLIAINGAISWIWGGGVKAVQSPFPLRTVDVGGVFISLQDVGVFCVCLGTVLAHWAFFRFTTLGLAIRAVAFNPRASRLVGVRVGWMLALGWGFAAVLGAVAGLMAVPTPTVGLLDPNMMLVLLIYGFAAAVLGGLDSPIGAIVGGLSLGVLLTLLQTYDYKLHIDLAELRLPVALTVLLVVLLIRPTGLFGQRVVRRV